MNVIGYEEVMGVEAKAKPKIEEALICLRKRYVNSAYLIAKTGLLFIDDYRDSTVLK